MATLDVHVEAPARRHRNSKTRFDRAEDTARFVFHKTIAGHYRNGRTTGYRRVGAHFITWMDDDMNVKQSEVDRLQAIFTTKFNFETQAFQIPSAKADTGLLRSVSEFIDKYNEPDNLMIVYYGGHGYKGYETAKLKLAAKFQPDGDGDPKAFFNDTFNCLRLPNTDILLIVDCCFAAHAFAAEGLGKRKYELIVSSSHDGDDAYVPAPKHPDSFTRRLCDTMEEMLQSPKYSNGFSTADLYRSVYHKQHAPKHDSDRVRHDIKPLLFDQSLFDYGRIWLRPHFTASESPSSVQKPKITINLTLRMVEMPNAAIMNEVARALQYVPHTEEITFEKLHAPQAEIQEFFYGMQRAMYIKRIMRKLRLRLEKRKREQEGGPTDQELKLRPSLRLDTKPDVSRSYDWSGAQAYLRDGTKLPVSMATGKQATRSPVADDDHGRMERLREWKASSEGGNQFSYTWSLDLPNLKNLAYRPWRHMVTRVMKPNADRVAGEPWPKFENHAFVLDEDEADAPVMNGVESFDIFMFAAIVVALGCILHASS